MVCDYNGKTLLKTYDLGVPLFQETFIFQIVLGAQCNSNWCTQKSNDFQCANSMQHPRILWHSYWNSPSQVAFPSYHLDSHGISLVKKNAIKSQLIIPLSWLVERDPLWLPWIMIIPNTGRIAPYHLPTIYQFQISRWPPMTMMVHSSHN